MNLRGRFSAVLVALLLAGCVGVTPAPTTTRSPTPTTGPKLATELPTAGPTLTPAPSLSLGSDWQRVNSDVLDATQGLDHALSADDAVYAVSSGDSCPDSCEYQVLVTSNGQEWRPMANPISNADSVNDLGFAGGRYVAVGMASSWAAIWTSLGGLWTQNDQADIFDLSADGGPGEVGHTYASGAVTITSVVTGPAGWLAGGVASCSTCPAEAQTRYAAWASTDSHTWNRQQWQAGPAGISGLASNGRSYVAVSVDGLWFSADGRAWQHVLTTDPQTARMVGVAASDGQYLAAELNEARGVVVSQSADGQQWTQLPASGDLAGAIPFQLQALSGKWVLIGSSSTAGDSVQVLWSSKDGQSWSGEVAAAEAQAHVVDVGAIGELPVVVGWFGDEAATGVGAAWVGSLP